MIDVGAHVNTSDDKGETALMCAAAGGHIACMNLLQRKGADVNMSYQPDDYWFAACIALISAVLNYFWDSLFPKFVEEDGIKCIKVLFKAGAHVNGQYEHGDNALLSKIFEVGYESMNDPWNKEILMLLFAAEDQLCEEPVFRRHNSNMDVEDHEVPDYLYQYVEPNLYLLDICRRAIRKKPD